MKQNNHKFCSILLVLVASALLTTACVVQPLITAPEADQSVPLTEGEEIPHWSHTGETGPQFWGELHESFALCGTGSEQSPIDLVVSSQSGQSDIVFDYQPADLVILNNGHTIQMNYANNSAIVVDGERFTLLQFHMHAPSEHTLDGQSFPLEIHFVHRNAAGELAVVGLLVEEGAHNQVLASLWENLPAEEVAATAIDGATVHAATLLPEDKTVYRYMGSLTTPPCSEQVRWIVFATPTTMSAEQIAAFTAIYHGNNRPVQLLNERTLFFQ